VICCALPPSTKRFGLTREHPCRHEPLLFKQPTIAYGEFGEGIVFYS
jgi:hypothetical protein